MNLEPIVKVLKSEKLDLVDFLFLSGQRERLTEACRVQLVWKGRMRVIVDKARLAKSAAKERGLLGFLAGGRALMSCVRAEAAGAAPEGLNFYERAIFSGMGERWFAQNEGGLKAMYGRQGLMKEGNVAYRGEELRGMYYDAMEALMRAVRDGNEKERVKLLNEHAPWYFAFFALPLPPLEPKALKAFVRARNAEYLEPVAGSVAVLSALNDAALFAVASAEAVS